MAHIFDAATVSVPAGDSLPVRLIIHDPVSGEPMDLTAYDSIEVALAPRSVDTDLAAVVTRTLGDGVELVGDVAGGIDIDWLPSDTRQAPGLYAMQVRLGAGDNVRRTTRPSHVIRILPSPLT